MGHAPVERLVDRELKLAVVDPDLLGRSTSKALAALANTAGGRAALANHDPWPPRFHPALLWAEIPPATGRD
jgi:hypothetical protein